MKTAVESIEGKIDELMVVLDNDIRYLQDGLSRLDELRGLVIRRDEASLSKLLEGMRSESESYSANELKRQSIREELACALNCTSEQLTLSRLERELSGEKKEQTALRRAKLKVLVDKLRTEHLSTALLLSDCARFNRALLNGIFKVGTAGSVTYDSGGSVRRSVEKGFVNLQF